MIKFLLENTVSRSIRRENKDIILTDNKGRNYFIKTLSKQEDFPYDFKKNLNNFDNDRARLNAIMQELRFFIYRKYQEGFIPGFVLLRADTDYDQLKKRTKPIVNEGHFLKQALYRNIKPDYDNKIMDPLEIVLQQFYRHNGRNAHKRISGKKREKIYFPELVYFNSNHNNVEVVWFANTIDPSEFKDPNCPVCSNPNGEKYDHRPCRETKDYTNYVLQRNQARYSKLILSSRQRRSLESRCNTRSEKGLVWVPSGLDNSKLELPKGETYIAVVK